MPHLRARALVAVVALAAVLLASCGVVGGGGVGNYKLSAWFPKTEMLK